MVAENHYYLLSEMFQQIPLVSDASRLTTYSSHVDQSFVTLVTPQDDKLFRIALIVKLVGGIQQEINNTALFILNEHIKQQLDNVQRSLQHETRNCIDMKQSTAINCLHYRMLEGYYCWAEKHKFDPISTGNPFAELLVYRVLLSLSEHILHCPERIAQVFHTILMEKVENMKGPYVINLKTLQRGLSQIHRCDEFPVINFDDINQCASGNTRRLRKSWYESRGPFVIIDIIRNLYPVLFFKAWVFSAVLWVGAIQHSENMDSLSFWTKVAMVDSIFYVFTEFILFLYAFFFQEREQSFGRRSLHRIVGLLLGFTCFVWTWSHQLDTKELILYFSIARILFCTIYLPIFENFLSQNRNFVKHGRPREARHEQNPSQFIIEEKEEKIREKKNIHDVIKKIIRAPFDEIWNCKKQAVVFWILMIIFTCLLEYFWVAPIGGSISFKSLCMVRRGTSLTGANLPCPKGMVFDDHECVACALSVSCVYLLVALSVFIDLNLIFNFILAIVGYWKGSRRGVGGIYVSSRLININPNGKLQLIFEFLFGSWEKGKHVWSTLATALYSRDLISDSQCKSLKECFEIAPDTRDKSLEECLETLNLEPRNRITYFLKTIESIYDKELEKKMITNDQIEENEKEFLESIPSLSQIITMFTENVMLSAAFLRSKSGSHSNIEYLVEKYSDEWEFFETRMIEKNIYTPQSNKSNVLLKNFIRNKNLSDELVVEIRLWASFRAQTVARTIRGALEYHDALRVRLRWVDEADSKSSASSESKFGLADMVELLIAPQLYGKLYNSQEEQIEAQKKRDDLNFLLERFKDYPISIVYDYERSLSHQTDENDVLHYWRCTQQLQRRKNIVVTSLCAAIHDISKKVLHIIKEYIIENEEEKIQMIHKETNRAFGDQFVPFRYATLVRSINHKTGQLELSAVIPRLFPLLLGKGAYRTQGKAGNHLNVIRKVWGHVTQVMDANMDGFIGEGFKLPFITHQFLSRTHSGRKRKPHIHRKYVNHRIIGFREYIFTHALGWVGGSMASSEATFGTIFQRVLNDPLDVRMHYGHPDFFDSFWMLNRGGLSKGSPRINLSEDVFAGYNIWLRGENIAHVDTLEWQKGRETVFITASMFLSKITFGSVGILRSRDSMDMNAGLNILQRASLFSGSISYFLTLVMLSYTFYLYATIFFLFSVAGVTNTDVETLNSFLTFEWVVGFGFASTLPFLSEQILENGTKEGGKVWLLKFIPYTLFYIFQNQTVAHSFVQGVITGEASYINTGRPSFFSAYSKKIAYKIYCRSHYYPALIITWLYNFRFLLNSSNPISAPLFLVVSVVFVWITGPIWFCPRSMDWEACKADAQVTFKFLFFINDDEESDTLFKFWKEKYAKDNDMNHSLPMITHGIVMFILFLIVASLSSTTGPVHGPFVGILFICAVLTLVWHLLPRYSFVTILWFLTPITFLTMLIIIGLNSNDTVYFSIGSWNRELDFKEWSQEFFIRLIVVLIALRLIAVSILLFASMLIRIFCASTLKSKQYYSRLVTLMYYIGLHFHLHLYFAIVIFAVQSLVEIILISYGLLIGLLNSRKSKGKLKTLKKKASSAIHKDSTYVVPEF